MAMYSQPAIKKTIRVATGDLEISNAIAMSHKRPRPGETQFDLSNPVEGDINVEGNKGNNFLLIACCVPVFLQVAVICILICAMTYFYAKDKSCHNNREIWCKDDWKCQKQTAKTDKVYSPCFQSENNLASCLFGPNSAAATKCMDYTKKGAACDCAIPKQAGGKKGANCLAGCPLNLKGVKDAICCCNPESPDCLYTKATLPAQCAVNKS